MGVGNGYSHDQVEDTHKYPMDHDQNDDDHDQDDKNSTDEKQPQGGGFTTLKVTRPIDMR